MNANILDENGYKLFRFFIILEKVTASLTIVSMLLIIAEQNKRQSIYKLS